MIAAAIKTIESMKQTRSVTGWRLLACAVLGSVAVAQIAACGGKSATGSGQESTGGSQQSEPSCETPVTGPEAVSLVQAAVADPSWKIAYLSNTGVLQSIVASPTAMDDRAAMLMRPDGRSCQWAVDLFRDEPTPVEQEGQQGLEYPLHTYTVWDGQVGDLPDRRLGVPTPLLPMPDEMVAGLGRAIDLALSTSRIEDVEVLSALSFMPGDGRDPLWDIRLYDKNQEMEQVWVDHTGQRVVDRPG